VHIGFFTPEYVTAANPDGGLANYLRKTGLALAARGHRVSIFLLAREEAAWQDGAVQVYSVPAFSLPAGFKRIRYLGQVLKAGVQVLSAQRLAHKAWAVHSLHPFDLFQTSSYRAPGYALTHNGRVPLVCRVSSYSPLIRAAYGAKPSLGDALSDWLEVRQVLEADACFTPSRFMADTYARQVGRRPDIIRSPVEDIPTGFDPTFYQMQFLGKKYLLFFGTLSRIKGVDLLAEALPPLFEKFSQLEVVFIGRDDGLPDGVKVADYLNSRCWAYVNKLHFYPALSKPQLFPVIEHALGVLFPSRVDNYPNAALEALSAGVPLIGSDDSSLEEMIIDGKTGFLMHNGEAGSLSAAIQRLLEMSLEARQEMVAHIQAQVASIQKEDRIGQLVSYYSSIIEKFHEGSR
jgi:glycosyltransferase involved in cell wall biosynthesis